MDIQITLISILKIIKYRMEIQGFCSTAMIHEIGAVHYQNSLFPSPGHQIAVLCHRHSSRCTGYTLAPGRDKLGFNVPAMQTPVSFRQPEQTMQSNVTTNKEGLKGVNAGSHSKLEPRPEFASCCLNFLRYVFCV